MWTGSNRLSSAETSAESEEAMLALDRRGVVIVDSKVSFPSPYTAVLWPGSGLRAVAGQGHLIDSASS